jgi:hypothetical protein
MDVKCFTNNEGKRFILTEDCKNIIATQCASATGCSCDPSRCPRVRAIVAGILPVGRMFDPMKPTIGSLVGVRLGASQTTAEVAATVNENENSSAHFDPKKPTVGDLTHLKSVHGHGHTSMGTISVEPGDIAVHPSRVKEVSR